jgi:hypothetical protein
MRMYRHLKYAADHADEEYCRRLVNIYVGAFVAAPLIAW